MKLIRHPIALACCGAFGRTCFTILPLMLAVACVAGCTNSNSSGPPPAVSTLPAPAVPTPAVPQIDQQAAVAQANESVPPLESPPETAPSDAAANEPAPAAGAPDPNKPRRIIGRKTSDIRDAQKEEAKGAQRVQPKITGQDPITISGSAYISIIGRTEVLKIQHAVNLFQAETGRYPKDLKEFMAEIIHKSGVRLAQLPFYQEYGYDAANHQLVILEYPDRKAASGR